MAEYTVTQTVHNELWVAHRIPNGLEWAVGKVGAGTDRSDEAQVELVRMDLDSIVAVPKGEENAANDTDGRRPDVLVPDPGTTEDDKEPTPVPVRPTLPGASLVAAHFALESIGAVPDTDSAEEAVYWTAGQMRRVDLRPVAPAGCVAGASYATIKENTVRFGHRVAGYQLRNELTYLPDSSEHTGYNPNIEADIIRNHRSQLRKEGRYGDLTPDTFIRVARAIGGDRAVASYVDDGRGMYGHVEGNILRLNTFGYAVDTRQLNERGGQSLTINDDMIRQTVGRLAFTLHTSMNYRTPLKHAMNMHANTVHGTLMAPEVPTWLVEKINSRSLSWLR